MDALIRDLKFKIAQFSDHSKHFVDAERCFDGIKKILLSININNNDIFPYIVQRGQLNYLASSITELNKSLIILAKDNLFSSIEALSRVAMEHSVNLFYLLQDENPPIRYKSLMYHYLQDTIAKTKKWHSYAIEHKISDSICLADNKISRLEGEINYHFPNGTNHLEKWPNTFDRFKKIGLEEHYRTLFATASDSVHSLSEDLYNFTVYRYYPEITHETHNSFLKAEKMSFAVYLLLRSLNYYCVAAYKLANHAKEERYFDELNKIDVKIRNMIDEHESLNLDICG
ncbi:MAG: hypothetical protein CXR30_01210 [Geobacter sp.]|nr:MAG: hypothetical protein CXR30_01210 [Geobacter sp.]